MARRSSESGGVEANDLSEASLAANNTAEKLKLEVAALSELDVDGLRARWRRLFRSAAPTHVPKFLMFRIIAYRIQANALGDLDRETVRFLDQVARDREERRERMKPGIKASKAPPPIPSVPNRRSLKAGTILVREHDGVLHRVMALEQGFAWNGGTYGSLSEVAFAITGTNWNGPRFFGLRGKGALARNGKDGNQP
jgi:hypothetical protein